MAKFIIEVDLDEITTAAGVFNAVNQMSRAFTGVVPPQGNLRKLLDSHLAEDAGSVILFEAIEEEKDVADGTVSARAVLTPDAFDKRVLARRQAEHSDMGLSVIYNDGRREDFA